MPDFYVDSFSYTLGERRTHVKESAAAGRLLSRPQDLETAGFCWHHLCGPDTTAYDLAKSATSRLTESGRLDRADAVVYSTALPGCANVGDPGDWERTRDVKYVMDFAASRLVADFDLDDAVVIGLSQQACTAMLGSLRVAAAMLTVEDTWQQVLCVTADRFPEGALYEQAYNLISDGAAACVVSRQPAAFRLLACHQITNGALGRATDDEAIGSYFGFTERLVRQTLAKAGLSPAELTWVVTQNTIDKVWHVLARLLGIPLERIWAPSMPEAGHVISADNIVNLSALVQSGRLRPGDLIALVMAGYGMNWQCALLEATGLVTS
jgi:3-oxoacyl-[acyl-carrier-protein] synthase III